MSHRRIAVIGGTGAEGRGLVLRWARAGHAVIVGSRDAARAAEAAEAARARLATDEIAGDVTAGDNAEAAGRADIVVLAVPYAAQMATVESLRPVLAGKILVDVTVPLLPPAVSRVQLPEGGSAVVAAQRHLGDAVRVVSAFQNVSSHLLEDLGHEPDCDVLVCADDREARGIVAGLVRDAGLRPVEGGVLANSAAAEALTSVLIAINRRYKVKASGIRFTGLPVTED